MATIFSHPVPVLAVGTLFLSVKHPIRLLTLGAVCSVVPDLDIIGYEIGIPYKNMFGHRGISHSILFALIFAAALVYFFFRHDSSRRDCWMALLYLFFATLSNAIFDALTNGGLGVAFFAPFWNERFFFPWQPVVVSSMGFNAASDPWPSDVRRSEFIWIWAPSLVFAATVLTIRYWSRRSTSPVISPR